MSDEGFDPCECIWSHEMAMRRLLSWVCCHEMSIVKCIDISSIFYILAPAITVIVHRKRMYR